MTARSWRVRDGEITLGPATLVMGVVNVTPDSFSDGGRFSSTTAAIAQGHALAAEGADLLDIGGESTRPGATPVDTAEEIARVQPVIAGLSDLGVPISVDTSKPEVAEVALDSGAVIVNDVSGVAHPAMVDLVARSGAGVVVMHMQGTPATMQDDPSYTDVVEDVLAHLLDRTERLIEAGIARESICIDPGIGFGKTFDHNMQLLAHIGRFAEPGFPLLVGTSRKGFLGTITGRDAADRDVATAASVALIAARGVDIVRVHNVAFARDARQVADAMVSYMPR